MWQVSRKYPRFGLLAATLAAIWVVSSGEFVARAADAPLSIVRFDLALDSNPEVVPDLSGNGNNGTLHWFDNPTAAYGNEDGGLTTFLSFDGMQHVATESSALPPSEFEIEVTFRTTEPRGKLFGFEDEADSGRNTQ